MDGKKTTEALPKPQQDVYEQTRGMLNELLAELSEAMDEPDVDVYRRKGYEMIGIYYRKPVNTGELMLTLTAALEDILHKLEMTQHGKQVSMVRGDYSVMKKDKE